MKVYARATRYDLITVRRISEQYIMILIIHAPIDVHTSVTLGNRIKVYMRRHIYCEISMAPVISVESSTVIEVFTKIMMVKYYRIVVIRPG